VIVIVKANFNDSEISVMSVTDISKFCLITEVVVIVNFALLSSFRQMSL
jgi:hypothetical protein